MLCVRSLGFVRSPRRLHACFLDARRRVRLRSQPREVRTRHPWCSLGHHPEIRVGVEGHGGAHRMARSKISEQRDRSPESTLSITRGGAAGFQSCARPAFRDGADDGVALRPGGYLSPRRMTLSSAASIVTRLKACSACRTRAASIPARIRWASTWGLSFRLI
jgi:hypothetical protein